MRRPLFGELLGRLIPLNGHDVEEILEDQAVTHRRFGEIAMSFGLCKPNDVWKAWWEQISDVPVEIDLSALGVDSQAVSYLPYRLAREFNVVALRAMGRQMVLAVSKENLGPAAQQLPVRLNMQLKFVYADDAAIRRAIDCCYAHATQPPAAA